MEYYRGPIDIPAVGMCQRPFYIVLFSMTKTAVEALCVLQLRHGNRGYWEEPSILLQVRTATAEYFMTLSNRADLVVSILRIGQQVTVLARNIQLLAFFFFSRLFRRGCILIVV